MTALLLLLVALAGCTPAPTWECCGLSDDGQCAFSSSMGCPVGPPFVEARR